MTQSLGLAAALAWPVPMIVALFLVARDRTLKYRILWAVVCFVGIGALWVQQSTGRWGFIPVAINLLGPGSQPGFYKATFPAGAVAVLILLWLRARKRASL
ncbi:hypothetical protein [Caulobacter segnis]|jgi:hypothetical protein|uniref:hypothetical protein n=1 Tax=Caulobacter segnis TaxID=88688 RepID=UPI001CC1ADAE|nr:hypothetical protein [Caulobacter segnis]UAL10321.1 hypothetical protein K8940_21570 [Caulobacter segnis]